MRCGAASVGGAGAYRGGVSDVAETLRAGEISDVFFHVGPLDPDGSISVGRDGNASELLAALGRLAPKVRAQAWIGQVTRRSDCLADSASWPIRSLDGSRRDS